MEITTERVNDFIVDSEEENELEELSHISRRSKPLWEKILRNVVDFSSSGRSCEDALTAKNGSISVPKVNGKHNKHVQHVSLANGDFLSLGNGATKMILANTPPHKEVLSGLESKIA